MHCAHVGACQLAVVIINEINPKVTFNFNDYRFTTDKLWYNFMYFRQFPPFQSQTNCNMFQLNTETILIKTNQTQLEQENATKLSFLHFILISDP